MDLLWMLAACSLIFSPVLLLDNFRKMFLFVKVFTPFPSGFLNAELS